MASSTSSVSRSSTAAAPPFNVSEDDLKLATRVGRGIDMASIKRDAMHDNYFSDEFLYQFISQSFPEDKLLLKDKALPDPRTEWIWVIDSSTTDVRIGLLYKGRPVFGINYYLLKDKFHYSSKGGLAYSRVGEGTFSPILPAPPLPNNVIVPILPPLQEMEKIRPIYEALVKRGDIEEFEKKGLFIYNFGYRIIAIAEGKSNLYVAPPGEVGFWDICSMIPLVEVKGGIVTDWEGDPIVYNGTGLLSKGVIVCMEFYLHQRIVGIIAQKKLLPAPSKEEEKKWTKV